MLFFPPDVILKFITRSGDVSADFSNLLPDRKIMSRLVIYPLLKQDPWKIWLAIYSKTLKLQGLHNCNIPRYIYQPNEYKVVHWLTLMCCLLFNRNLTGIKILATHLRARVLANQIRRYKSKNLIPATSLEFLPEASQQNSKAAQSSCS